MHGKIALGMTLACLSYGCGQSETLRAAGQLYSKITDEPTQAVVSRDMIDAIPYASLIVQAGVEGPRALLIMAYDHNPEFHWVSADQALLITRSGRVTRTVGLPSDLSHTATLTQDYLATLRSSDLPNHFNPVIRRLDFPNEQRFGVQVACAITEKSAAALTIETYTYQTAKFTETCQAQDMDWRVNNTYWVERNSNLLVASIQHTTPASPPLIIEVGKYYAPPPVDH